VIPETLAIIGGGNMGRALIGGLLHRGVPASAIRVGEAIEPLRRALAADFGVHVTADNADALRGAHLVILAVKPQDAAAVLAPLRAALQTSHPVMVSIAAGIRVESLEQWCGPGVPVVRTMPNRPALVGAGATGLYARASVPAAARAAAEGVMQAVGTTEWVDDESLLDVVTALSGSGPAYCFLLAELMADAAASLGLDPAVARRLAVQTLHGAGAMAAAGDGDLARLRAEVTSKGGTTEAALRSLASDDLQAVVRRALTAATERGRELAAQAAR